MIRITFTEADRAAFGLDSAELLYDEGSLRVSEVRRLQSLAGLSVKQWGEGLNNGDTEAIVALVWLALARAGVTVGYADLDFDLAGLKFEPVVEDSPGKDPSTPETTSE
jgi:hypothetical protein